MWYLQFETGIPGNQEFKGLSSWETFLTYNHHREFGKGLELESMNEVLGFPLDTESGL